MAQRDVNRQSMHPPRQPIDRLRSDLRDDAEMFDLAPVSLWLEDFSGVRALFEEWRPAGRHATSARISSTTRRASRACSEPHQRHQGEPRDARALRGRRACSIWSANLGHVFRDDMLKTYIEELVAALGRRDASSPATP